MIGELDIIGPQTDNPGKNGCRLVGCLMVDRALTDTDQLNRSKPRPWSIQSDNASLYPTGSGGIWVLLALFECGESFPPQKESEKFTADRGLHTKVEH